MRRPLLLLFFLIASSALHAQNQSLRLARSVYEQGRLQEIPSILTDSLIDKRLSLEEKVEAYKLLCLTNIYLEEPEQADDYMLKILQTNHEFVLNRDADPAEFVALYETFRHDPVYRIGARLGLNATQPNVVSSISAVDVTNDSQYNYGIGMLFGAIGELPINKKMTLQGELIFIQKRFSLDMKVNRGTDEFGNTLINEFQGIESQSWLSLPFTFQYRIVDNKFDPYIAGGASIDYLLGAKLVGERSRAEASSIPQTTFELKPQRKNLNVSAVVAAGAKIKISGGYIVAEVRYTHGLTKVNSEETAYANQQAVWEQGYTDSVFKMSSLSLTGSYIYNIFKPKKLKSKK